MKIYSQVIHKKNKSSSSQRSRDQFVCAPSQWETTLLCNVVSHWLSTYSKWSLEVNVSNLENIKALRHWPLCGEFTGDRWIYVVRMLPRSLSLNWCKAHCHILVSQKSVSDDSWWRHQMETFSVLLAILCRKFTGHRWIPHTKASDAELWCFLWSVPE